MPTTLGPKGEMTKPITVAFKGSDPVRLIVDDLGVGSAGVWPRQGDVGIYTTSDHGTDDLHSKAGDVDTVGAIRVANPADGDDAFVVPKALVSVSDARSAVVKRAVAVVAALLVLATGSAAWAGACREPSITTSSASGARARIDTLVKAVDQLIELTKCLNTEDERRQSQIETLQRDLDLARGNIRDLEREVERLRGAR